MNPLMSSREAAEQVLALTDRLLGIKKLHGYSDEDARGATLSNCRSAALSAVMTLNIISTVEEGRISGEDFKKFVGITSGTLQSARNIWYNMTRLGFLVIYQFQVENLLRNILEELTGKREESFFQIAKSLSQLLPDSDRKLELLYLLAHIRNSLHGQGIHHGYKDTSTTVVINGCSFEFLHLQKVSCAGWGHLCIALQATADVLEELLSLPQVRAIPDPMWDQYVWEMATLPNDA